MRTAELTAADNPRHKDPERGHEARGRRHRLDLEEDRQDRTLALLKGVASKLAAAWATADLED